MLGIVFWIFAGLGCFIICRILYVSTENIDRDRYSSYNNKAKINHCDITVGVITGLLVSLVLGPIMLTGVLLCGVVRLTYVNWDRQLFNICDFFKKDKV